MRRLIVPLTLLLGLVPAVAAPPAVKFPEVVSPAPMPSAVATLTKGRLFVVESKEKVTILSSPDGLVEVMERKGPFSVYSKFADGPDEEQFRTYDGPFVFILRPVKSGECELLVIPEKVTGKDDIARHQLRVDAGGGPKPPPVDPVEPDDPLFEPLKAAWEKGKNPDALAKLLKVYRAAAATDLSAFATAGDLRSALKDKVKENGLGEDDLRPVREVIQGELERFLPKLADAPLTQDHRANAKSAFTRIVTCLGGLK